MTVKEVHCQRGTWMLTQYHTAASQGMLFQQGL